jgi:hypothetical protein
MRVILLYVFLFSIPVFSQNPIEIKIDSLVSEDIISGERKFVINYHIENLTSQEISFFLNPNHLVPAHFGSMGTSVLYKLYQNDEVVNTSEILRDYLKKDVFNQPDFSLIKDEKERRIATLKYYKDKFNINLDSIAIENDKENNDSNYFLKQSSKRLMSTIFKLKPKEIKKYTYTFYWDKTRYYKEDEYEYYLNENSNFYMELYLILLKEDYKERLLAEDFKKVSDDKNWIKGVFISNKIEINFNE